MSCYRVKLKMEHRDGMRFIIVADDIWSHNAAAARLTLFYRLAEKIGQGFELWGYHNLGTRCLTPIEALAGAAE
jgi:hypothetical protein